jgi:hypothetical protein
MRTKAKEAVEAAINLFHCVPLQAPWHPQYITDCGEAWDTLVSYPSYKVAKKWGITVELEESWRSSWMASYTYWLPKGTETILMWVCSPDAWFHELCHAAKRHVDYEPQKRKTFSHAIEETIANLGTAALLYLWYPNLDGELRYTQELVETFAQQSACTLSELCEDAREEAEKRVAAILEEA